MMSEMRKRLEAESTDVDVPVQVGEHELNRMKMTIKNMITKNPRSVATVLKRWISGK